MSLPRHAFPAMRPRCCFLYLTFFGIIMAVCPQFLIGSRRNLPASALLPAWSRPERLRRPVFPDALPVSRKAVAAPSTAAESEPPDALPDAAGRKAESVPRGQSLPRA